MACEILTCCQFFKDNMSAFPETSEYIKQKLCLGDYESCNRFKIYKEFGGEDIPADLDPYDIEEVKKAVPCLRNKRLSEKKDLK